MKKLIKIVVIILFFNNIYCQTPYPGLYSPEHKQIFEALDEIIENHDIDAIEILHSLIITQTPYIQLNYLDVLSELEDEEIITYINEFIDRSDEFSSHEYREDPLEMKVKATELLIENNDFSTIDYVFEYYDIYTPNFTSLQVDVLGLFPLIANNVPNKVTIIKENLIFVLHNSTAEYNRFSALFLLDEIFGSGIIDQFIWAIDDVDQSIRSFSIDKLLEYQSPSLNALLKERLAIDPGRSLRTQIAALLLTTFGVPSDLKFVIDYQPNEPNETTYSLIGHYIREFIPPRPTVPTSEMIDNLINYTKDLLDYGWITKQSVYQNYVKTLRAIQEADRIESLALLCENLDLLISSAEEQRETALITEEAYKFLYYHGNYIIDNVETEFGECP